MKEVGKIYSAVDADELEAGDYVQVSDDVNNLKNDKGIECRLEGLTPRYYFLTAGSLTPYQFAKLLCPRKHAETYMAWKTGKKVEVYVEGADEWFEVDENAVWKEDVTFRIAEEQKPKEPAYRPFRDIDELVDTWAKMMGYSAKRKSKTMPLIWVRYGKDKPVVVAITGFDHKTGEICAEGGWYNLLQMFNGFKFLDGTPFGVGEE